METDYFEKYLITFARRFALSPSDTDDYEQEGRLVAWHLLKEKPGINPARVVNAIRYKMIDRRRHEERRVRSPNGKGRVVVSLDSKFYFDYNSDDSNTKHYSSFSDTLARADARLRSFETREDLEPKLDALLGEMDVRTRQIFYMRYSQGMSQEEIGKVLGISHGAVNHRLLKLAPKLKQRIQELDILYDGIELPEAIQRVFLKNPANYFKLNGRLPRRDYNSE